MARGMRWSIATLLALLAGLLGCAAGTPAPEQTPAAARAGGPLLWRAEAPSGGVVYLMGSVHLGRDRIDDFGAAVEAAWRAADELVVELDVTELSSQDKAALAAQYGALDPPQTLRDTLSDETWSRLTEYRERRRIDASSFSGWKPWFVYFVIVQHELQRAGYRLDHGVDRLFLDAASGKKPIAGLETAASQLEAFDRVPLPLQALILNDALLHADSFPDEAAELIDAWYSGEEERLRKLVFRPLEELPELEVFYDLVFFQRNRNMVSRLAELSSDGRTRFVVVGAGHMVGEQSIPTLLGERGWPVARVSGAP